MRKKIVLTIAVLALVTISLVDYALSRPAEPVTFNWNGSGLTDEVVVPLRPEEDAIHLEDDENYFEWWYFDAHLENGYSVVGVLHARHMGSGQPETLLEIHTPTGENLSADKLYSESDLRASAQECDVWLGGNHVHGHYPKYHLFISEGELEADLTFYSQMQGWKPGEGKFFYGDDGYFAWVVPVPRAQVEGTIKIGDKVIPVSGTGYHDHNWGTVDLSKVISYWYWGRLYANDFTLIYADVAAKKHYRNTHVRPLMLACSDQILLSTGEVVVREGEETFSQEANRAYPAHLDISVPGKVSVTLEVKEVTEATDFLEDRNPILKWVVNTFLARPAYFRFLSDFTMHVEHEGQTYDLEGETLHEMIAFE
ncbi:hypothetical protein CVT91_04325 [Candidatus Atribacteria bacterium HGW-Atribacteria-1]|nr:MAG: hypothetical protein CVT91_04325 [Candidatus Atribacteria bacterium HGW-Atribacteria-1]